MAKHALAGVTGFVGTKQYFMFDPKKIIVKNNWNPRTDFSGEADLVESIIESGVEVPLLVRKSGEEVILIDGERRLRAALKAINEGAEIAGVPIIVARKNISDIEALTTTLIRNDGKPLAPVEEAQAFGRLIKWGIEAREIAKRIGKSDVFVYQRLKLIDATPEIASALAEGAISIKDASEVVEESGGSIEGQSEALAGKIKQKKRRFSTIKASWDGEFSYKASKIDDKFNNRQDEAVIRQFLDAVHQHLEAGGFIAGEIKISARRELG